MVEIDAIQQAFANGNPTEEITFDDVLLFANEDDEAINRRFANLDFLPMYLNNAMHDVVTIGNAGGMAIDEFREFAHSKECAFSKANEKNVESCYATARLFITAAFRLFEILQNDKGKISKETASEFIGREEINDDGTLELTAGFFVPSCDYLQFIANGCDSVSNAPLFWDCYLHPRGGFEKDAVTGWVTSSDGAELWITSHNVSNNAKGYRSFLNELLIVLLDLHLYDVQMVAYGIGKHTFITKHAVAALWVKLREELGGGRTYTCRVCGRHCVARNERKEKAQYCKPHGGCSRAFSRVREILGAISDGAQVDEAVRDVPGISKKRFIEIAARNERTLAAEFPNVDFKSLLS